MEPLGLRHVMLSSKGDQYQQEYIHSLEWASTTVIHSHRANTKSCSRHTPHTPALANCTTSHYIEAELQLAPMCKQLASWQQQVAVADSHNGKAVATVIQLYIAVASIGARLQHPHKMQEL